MALGREANSFGVSVLLGPGVNIRRDPRGGRNFEYFSEDPIQGSELAISWVHGVQSQGVAASLKHFAANNAETDRLRSNSIVDARALREIYLRSFERVVKNAMPWTVMCSYNKVNGVSASQNRWLLTEVLRNQWGFDGVVVSDWGAVSDRVTALQAGLDLEMPTGGEGSVEKVVSAILDGRLEEQSLDRATSNIFRLAERVNSLKADVVDFDYNHLLAREAAARSVVLLKNVNNILPLRKDSKVAVIGPFAVEPRFQGGGSSHVVPTRLDVSLDEMRARSESPELITYSPGFRLDQSLGDGDLLSTDACAAAAEAELAVVFLGLAAKDESEGFDRSSISLPNAQIALLEAIVRVQPNTVVVLSHGGTLLLGEVKKLADAVLTGALLGQGGGHGIAAVLYGAINPSGRLVETVPLRLEDAPSFTNFPGEFSEVLYGESIFVGYRGYDLSGIEVCFPFGHGLSYTDFSYGDLIAEREESFISVKVEVTNTGMVAGREVVQFYAGLGDSIVRRPPQELKAFSMVDLEPGETALVEARIEFADLEHWDPRTNSWALEGGSWTICAAASSRDKRASVQVELEKSGLEPLLSMTSTISEVLEDSVVGPVLAKLLPKQSSNAGELLGMDLSAMLGSFPVGSISLLSPAQKNDIEMLIAESNALRAEAN